MQDYSQAVSWAAQTALRDIIGRTALADRLSRRRCFVLRSDDELGCVGERIVGVPAIAFEEGARLDGKRLMQNIAFNVAGGAKLHFARADTPLYPATDDSFFGKHVAGDNRFFTDD